MARRDFKGNIKRSLLRNSAESRKFWGAIAPGNDSTPIFQTGMIVMWSGSVGAIPSGWLLCDGTNGTPNLVDKFVRGTGTSGSIGTTGGSDTHTHTAHSYTPTGTNSAIAASGSATSMGGTTIANTVADNTHTHAAPTFTGDAASLTHTTVDNIPAYYYLAFIIKI